MSDIVMSLENYGVPESHRNKLQSEFFNLDTEIEQLKAQLAQRDDELLAINIKMHHLSNKEWFPDAKQALEQVCNEIANIYKDTAQAAQQAEARIWNEAVEACGKEATMYCGFEIESFRKLKKEVPQ